ncbi:hypothetical protein AHiyo1_51170 [Arthrobacter sp. Hiyo1]|nr:hypothetical protein AHiyo1_51170 [Arthrobacter sp. Hiyo1]
MLDWAAMKNRGPLFFDRLNRKGPAIGPTLFRSSAKEN